jgi:hypothetical protein
VSEREELMALRRMAELEAKAGSTPKELTTQDLYEQAKAKGWGSGSGEFFYNLGGKATDAASSMGMSPETAAKVGVGANIAGQMIPAFLASGRIQGPSAPSLPDWATFPQRKLMQTTVKPSSSVSPKDADAALRTMLRENIYPTNAGMSKATGIAGKMDKQVEKLIAGSQAQVPVAKIGDMRALNTKVMKQMNPQDDLAAVKDAWDKFRTSPLIKGKTEIPVQLAHELKKGTYSSLAGKYGEVGSASTEAQKTLARNARELVGEAVPSVKEPLARQAALMNVREVAGPRAAISGNQNPFGLGALRMDDPKSAATFLLDRWGAFKAFLAMQINAGTKPEVLAPLVIAEATSAGQEKDVPALMRFLQSSK